MQGIAMSAGRPLPRRRSPRRRGHDYTQAAAYFVTICTQNRVPTFGHVAGGMMCLNEIGAFVAEEWEKSSTIRQEIVTDAFVVMPDHVHGIVAIRRRGDRPVARTTVLPTARNGPVPASLGAFIAGFKAAVTVRINRARHQPGAAVWQRGYHESLIRDAAALDRIRRYIRRNPKIVHG